MKRISIVVILVCVHSFCINAQVYIKTLAGYSLSSNPEAMQSVEIVNGNKNVYVSKMRNGSGVNLGFAGGVKLNRNFSIELVGNTQLFTTQNTSVPMYDLSILYNSKSSFSYSFEGFFGDKKYTNSMFQISPQIVYTIRYKKNRFYIKAGPDFMLVKNKSQYNYTSWNTYWPKSGFTAVPKPVVEEINTRGGIDIGIQSAFGTEYLIAEGVSLFAEIFSVNINYKFTENETTRYDIDGKSDLSDIKPGYHSIENAEKTDFSHVGLNIGIKYIFKKR